MASQVVHEFNQMPVGEPDKLRARAKGLRDKQAADQLVAKAEELERQTSAFACKHMQSVHVSPCPFFTIHLVQGCG